MEIYKTVNLINNKIYIGKDTKNRSNYLGSGKLIRNAIQKYGRENFIKFIIDTADTNEELCVKEIYWIKELNSTDPLIGYNIRLGGEGIYKGTILSEEHRIALSKALKNKWKDLHYRQKMKNSVADLIKNKKGIFSQQIKKKIEKVQNILNKRKIFFHCNVKVFFQEKRILCLIHLFMKNG